MLLRFQLVEVAFKPGVSNTVKQNRISACMLAGGGPCNAKEPVQHLVHKGFVLQVMVEAYRRDASSKDQLISELKATKKRLNSEVKGLKQELLNAQGERKGAELEQSRLGKEVARVQQQMTSLQTHLESAQRERDQLELQLQVQDLERVQH